MFEEDDEMDDFMTSLSDEVMNGSQPLPSGDDAENRCSMDVFDQTVLENIFSCLPISDMFSCCVVCHRWNNIISEQKFMPWKKKYAIARSSASCPDLDELLLYVRSRQEEKMFHFCAMIRFIAYHTQWTLLSEQRADLLEILTNHRLSSLATSLVNTIVKPTFKDVPGDVEKFPTLQVFDVMDDVWYLLPTILLLCSSVDESHQFVRLLSTIFPLRQLFDLIYFTLTIMWVFYKQMDVCIQEHNKLFYVISKIESSSFRTTATSTFNRETNCEIQLTPEQMQVVRHPFKSNHLVRVMAFAGTGKTTTLVQAVRSNTHLTFLYTSFSKAVIDQAKSAFCFDHNVKVSTFHSLAYRAMDMGNHRQKLSRGTLYLSEIREKLELGDPKDRRSRLSREEYFPIELCIRNALFKYMASAATDICISHVQSTFNKADKDGVMTKVTIPHFVRQEVFNLTKKYWRNMTDMSKTDWKLSDDCYLKLWQLQDPKIVDYDVIMLDEAQDLTNCMLDIVKKQMPHCALVFVGDPYQQIYGFRRAYNALEKPIFPRTTYYLTQSFRFGYEIATVADAILREVKYKQLHHRHRRYQEKTLLGVGKPGFITGRSEGLERVAFLCRSNVGVVTKTLQLLNMEENKEKSVGIIGGTQKMGLDSLMDLYFVYKPKYERRRLRLRCRNQRWRERSMKEIKLEAQENEDNQLLTKIEIVEHLGDRIPKAVEMLKELPTSYTDCNIAIGTIHQAKGLEFDNVVIAEFPLLQTIMHVEAHKLPMEDINLLYVAVTRAKRGLVIDGDFYQVLCKWKLRFWTPQLSQNVESPYFCAICKQMKETGSSLVVEISEVPKFQDKGTVCPTCNDQHKTGWTALLTTPVLSTKQVPDNSV